MSAVDARNELALLEDLNAKVRWLSTWMIHHANNIRPHDERLKIGGHQASSASLSELMSALYFAILRPEDRVAVKPHASPVFHAIQYLLGHQDRARLEAFRGFGGAQSYPSRTKDADDVDFSTGSVGLGVGVTVFASLIQDYLAARAWRRDEPLGRMVALVGDAELDEGNVFEALFEGWKHDLRNTWWVIDYNRQSLDGVVHEGLYERITDLFRSLGWDVVLLKYGERQRRLFAEPGGEAVREWIDACPNPLYSALTFQGGAAWRERLGADFGSRSRTARLIGSMDDDTLAAVMTNLGGHDLPTILNAFRAVDHDRPVCFLGYTVKGHGLPLQGHKDNHAGVMTAAQMATYQAANGIREGYEWERFEGLAQASDQLQAFLDQVPFNARGTRRYQAAPVPVTLDDGTRPTQDLLSTQDGFGRILNEIGRSDGDLARRIVTMSPDVTASTNLGAWVNRRGLFAREAVPDTFREQQIPSAQKWVFDPSGQHIELGIAEMNLFLQLTAAGLSHSLFGERLIPIGTVYDPFVQRGLDALNYGCYQDARFIIAGTPSGLSLAGEGGAHQSIGTPLIGMAQDGLASFEPAFVDELWVQMYWAFDYLQRDGSAPAPGGEDWLRDSEGGAVYLRLSTLPLEQPRRTLDAVQRQAIVDGAYWMRPPGPNTEIAIVYSGVIAPEALLAAGRLGENFRDIAVLAVTSADRLNAGWHAASRRRQRGQWAARSHIETLLEELPADCGLVTVLDGHPTTLSWLGGVLGHRVVPLGVEHFGQTGELAELYRHYRIDADAIVAAAQSLAPRRQLHAVRRFA